MPELFELLLQDLLCILAVQFHPNYVSYGPSVACVGLVLQFTNICAAGMALPHARLGNCTIISIATAFSTRKQYVSSLYMYIAIPRVNQQLLSLFQMHYCYCTVLCSNCTTELQHTQTADLNCSRSTNTSLSVRPSVFNTEPCNAQLAASWCLALTKYNSNEQIWRNENSQLG
jgi:hypothetical protein